jgi:hypothetical protein
VVWANDARSAEAGRRDGMTALAARRDAGPDILRGVSINAVLRTVKK